ncbi:SIMPL domain-containing protein [Lutimaribacter sp. EGI FJ00015]|uniref:SIMPL domain-containing protein n=1 Tax=Lutimaribacter degradans TaxID=2945989 RepID=A0ACC5ZR62_9RHOB|nr:SIMPL domain-containing protein [Lutimaribacter sp. EGI FJ00013]MCM2560650.1 SIMPL domain-containing protein [Lutimaribacter sp. EGI FJ00013]MCO0612407.1 SIMPL domain-containing protein [Lutimaribacter sp. EGI FJ00015]MCO0634474.1 SIMPL domain-containing protein [Lutimaribacter sp. EGI FJ00014]
MKNLILAAALIMAAVPALAQDTARIMTVTGNGVTTQAPDMMIVMVGVESRKKTAQEAMAETSAAMTRLQERLQAEGVAPRDIQTTQVSLDAVYDNQPDRQRTLAGFSASNTVTVRVRELAKAGSILGALVEDGANRIGRVSFALQDSTKAMDDARRDAVSDARRKATLLAEAAGVQLGALRDIREVGGGNPDPMPMARMAAESVVPLAEGELTLNAAVTLVYEIE